MTAMQKWTDAKLQKELAFARGFALDDTEARDWLARLEAEQERRRSGSGTQPEG